jgi:DGQHR domain-containing protein
MANFKTFNYTCLVTRQRSGDEVPEFCMFFAPAGEILAWSAIERIQDKGAGFQRLAVPARIRGVKRFLEQDARNTIPTAVILTLRLADGALPPANDNGARVLTMKVRNAVKDPDKPGLVIDGQHRLMGINDFSPNTIVPVVALLNPSELETAFQFLVINNKSAKVPPDHLRKLALNYSPEGLEHRLTTARLSLKKNYAQVGQVDEEADSPFHKMIRWPTPEAQERAIVPAAIETALQFIETQQLQPLKDDMESLLEFFYAIWKPVKKRWKKAWVPAPKSNLLTKVGIVCLTQYLTDS